MDISKHVYFASYFKNMDRNRFFILRKIFKALKSEKGSDAGIFKNPQKTIQFEYDNER